MKLPKSVKKAIKTAEDESVKAGYDILSIICIEKGGYMSGDLNMAIDDPDCVADILFTISKSDPIIAHILDRVVQLVVHRDQTAHLN